MSMRSPSLEAVEFFPSIQGTSRLPSPPPSSPIVSSNIVCGLSQDRGHDSSVSRGLQNSTARQTRLDEYRSRFTSTRGGNGQSMMTSEDVLPVSPIDTTIPSMMICEPEMNGIDLSHGIVSSRQPCLPPPPPTNHLHSPTQPPRTPDLSEKSINNRPANNVLEMREFAKKFASPSTPTRYLKSSPKTPRSRKPHKNVPPACPETPPSTRTPIKTRSISESPGHTGPPILETSLNPWTIAATTYRSPQRPTITSPSQLPGSSYVRRPMCEQGHVGGLDSRWNPWTIAALVDRSSKRRRVEIERDEMEMDRFRGDMELHMVYMVCDVSMEEVIAEVNRSLRSGPTQTCDLTEFLFQYCSL